MSIELPRLYAIVDVDSHGDPVAFVRTLLESGVTLLQLRNKKLSSAEFLSVACAVRAERDSLEASSQDESSAGEHHQERVVDGKARNIRLIINDDVELCRLSGADGVHLGQADTPVSIAREILGANAIVGLSTHNGAELQAAPTSQLSYVAAGPIFLSSTKSGHAPVLGLDGLSSLARMTALPLVAIGGITEQNVGEVLTAGAASVAVISALADSTDLRRTIRAFSGEILPERG